METEISNYSALSTRRDRVYSKIKQRAKCMYFSSFDSSGSENSSRGAYQKAARAPMYPTITKGFQTVHPL